MESKLILTPEKLDRGRWVWDENLPDHFRGFLAGLADAEGILDAHATALYESVSPKPSDGQPITITETPTVFLRTAIVYVCSVWEAFIEDLLLVSSEFVIQTVDDTTALPKGLRRAIASKLKASKNELSPWELSADGWRACVDEYIKQQVRDLNTPTTANIAELYQRTLDFDVMQAWAWKGRAGEVGEVTFDRENTKEFIDSLVKMRNAIAHGRQPKTPFPCSSFFLMNVVARMQKISSLLHQHLNSHLEQMTTVRPWNVDFRYEPDWTPFCTTRSKAPTDLQ